MVMFWFVPVVIVAVVWFVVAFTQPATETFVVLLIEYQHECSAVSSVTEKFMVSVALVWLVLFTGRFIVITGAVVSGTVSAIVLVWYAPWYGACSTRYVWFVDVALVALIVTLLKLNVPVELTRSAVMLNSADLVVVFSDCTE